MVGAPAVKLRRQGAEDVEPRLALDDGQLEQRPQVGAAVGMQGRLGFGEHDVVLDAARHAGQVVRPERPDVDEGRGVDEKGIGPDGVVVEADPVFGDPRVDEAPLDGRFELARRGEVGPDVGLDADGLPGLDEFPERLDGIGLVEELHDGLVEHPLEDVRVDG